jgi:AcrR family transcriptional regulator
MQDETIGRPKLTAKGARTRARIVQAAATLIHERGVAATTLDDVKAAAEVSGSQMYHYFPDKNDLVQAVIDFQAESIVENHRLALSGANGVEAWRDMVIAGASQGQVGGCPLGSLVGQLAEADPDARSHIAAGFDQWTATLSDGFRSLNADGELPFDIDPDDLATTFLAALEGGLLLAQAGRSSRPYETAVNTLLALTIGNRVRGTDPTGAAQGNRTPIRTAN